MSAIELFADIFWPVLIPLSILYNLIAKLRFFLYQKGILSSHKLEGYTISVGNIEVGGTGKTPIVIDLCKYLTASGKSLYSDKRLQKWLRASRVCCLA